MYVCMVTACARRVVTFSLSRTHHWRTTHRWRIRHCDDGHRDQLQHHNNLLWPSTISFGHAFWVVCLSFFFLAAQSQWRWRDQIAIATYGFCSSVAIILGGSFIATVAASFSTISEGALESRSRGRMTVTRTWRYLWRRWTNGDLWFGASLGFLDLGFKVRVWMNLGFNLEKL